jgi:carboxymethylenebutenolidase
MSEFTVKARDGGTFSAYLARPAISPAPGLVLIQYICGVNQVMRRLADQFAAMGWIVMVPDIYWRQEPGVQLIANPAQPSADEMARAMALNGGLDEELAIADLVATADALRVHPDCDGRIGALGYCLGGRLVLPLAARTPLECGVSYYGVNLDRYLDEALRVTAPMLFHMAGEDALVPEPVRRRIMERLGACETMTVRLHPDVNHAFALPSGPNYVAETAIRANSESYRFLARHLRPPNADLA